MNAPSNTIFFLLFILLTSCSQKEEDTVSIPATGVGTSYYHYQQRALTKDRREKLFHINQGLKALKSEDDTLFIDLLRHKTINHYYLDELDNTVTAAADLITVAGKDDPWNKARGHFFRGWAFIQLGKNEASFKDSFRAKELFLQLQDSAYVGRASLNMAIVQQSSGDYSGAQQSAIETLKFLNPEKDSSSISSAYNEIGRSYLNQNLHTDAINSFQKALEFSTHNKSKTISNANIGYSLNETGAVKEAIEIFESLLTFDELSLEQNYTYRLELAYLKHKQDPSLDIAKDLELTRQFFMDQKNLRKLQLTYEYLIIFNKERNPNQALDYARKRLKAAKTYGNPQSTLDALEKIVELGSPKESKTHALEYIRLSDSLSERRMRTRNLFAKIQYDQEQKELEILDLERENAVQLAQIAQQQQRITIIGAVALFLIVGTIFVLYVLRQRHRREKQLQVYNTESRIAKKVHDELANDIYIVMNQLENKIPLETSDKLEHIYERTRDISRENTNIQTGTAFGEEFHGMLHSYLPIGARFLTPDFEEMPWNSLPAEKQIAVYRSLQELMTNMKKHSQAKVVVLNFKREKNWILIKYADRGIGIDTDNLKYKHGLKNVENRISAIGGTFTFESTLGDGVKAEINIPL